MYYCLCVLLGIGGGMQNLSLHQQSAVARSQLGTGSSQVSLVNVYLCMCVCAHVCMYL